MGYAKIKKHSPKLERIRTGSIKERREVLLNASHSLLCAIFSCCLNLLNGVVKLTKKQRDTLVRHRKLIRDLTDRSVALENKRELLIKRGGFLPALLTIIQLHGRKTYGISPSRRAPTRRE